VPQHGPALSYAELDARSDAVAAAMAARGVREGDVIALRLPSQPPYVVAYAAAAKLGAITAGLNPRLAAREQDALVDLVAPRLVLDDEALVTELTAAGAASAAPPAIAAHPERGVALVFTSGTTGVPKAALFCERQLDAVWRIDVGGVFADEPGAPMLASTQFAHIGIMTKLPWYLALGSRIHLLDRWRAADALAVTAEQRMPSIGGIAPQVALMLREPAFDAYDLSAVQTIVMGGAPSPPALVEEARRRIGAAYSIRYSSTESGGCGTGTAFDADDEEALFTVGRSRPGVEVRIDRGADTEVGEVLLRSPTNMTRYWNDPDATARTLVDGWLHTGDLGFIDERGLLHLAGRSNEMYIRGGYNVYPMEVEAQLGSHRDVAECAVIARTDDVMGEIGVAVVVPRDHTRPPSLESIRRHLADRLATYKHPEALEIVEELPHTSMHKIDRRALAARFGKL
jgi:acyl-CoA synthetase (AMP-forming)/AMP-acid ligase II